MSAEKQIIGSLLLDPTRIDDMQLINSEMFTDPMYGEIFSLYAHAEGKEINHHSVISVIKSDCISEKAAMELLTEIINEHDSGISDEYACKNIYDAWRTRQLDNRLNNMRLDPNNLDNSIDDLKDLLDSLSRPAKTTGRTLSALTAYKGDYFKDRGEKRFTLGFTKIDKAIGNFDGGDVVVIAARPGIGKSAFSLQMIRKFGRDGFKVGCFNLEMAEKQIYERAIAAASGIDMTRIRLGINFLNDEKEKFDKGNEILAKETNVYTYTGSQTVNSIRTIQKIEKFNVIVIDYMQLLQPAVKRNNRVNEVGDISRGLKAIATEFNIPVIALSQLNRASELNKDKEPSMSELRESGDIEQDASVILMLWNPKPEDDKEKMIKVEKSRNGYTDRETLFFDGKHMTFSTIDIQDNFKDADEEDPPFD